VTTLETDRLISPHGGSLVDRTGDRPEGVEDLERIVLTSREVSDLDMLASGALSPLEGFMGRDDYDRVVEEMRLASGLVWALPVCLAVATAPNGDRVALADEAGTLLAVLDVDEVYEYDKEREAERCFRTTDDAHPGVARLYAQHPLYLAGRVTVFERPRPQFEELARDPAETRRIFAERGWKRVVGFQTRNPIHRAHEYLTKVALETVDGLLIHPLVGDTKSDDVPAATRVECYRVLLEQYYPPDRVLLSAFPAAMRYAGPREAVWHAICRKNYGCSHFIVGRDHAGVGEDLPAPGRAACLPFGHEGARAACGGPGAAGGVHPPRGRRGADRGLPRRLVSRAQQGGLTPGHVRMLRRRRNVERPQRRGLAPLLRRTGGERLR
jgi:sulfate adenylyltransferase